MDKVYFSHYRESDQTWQTNEEHQRNVAKLTETYCPLPELKKASFLAGLFHDSGKNTEEWSDYLKASVEGRIRGLMKIDHSTLGGVLVDSYFPNTVLSAMLQTAIYMHHGLQDSVSLEDGTSLLERRRSKFSGEVIERARKDAELLYADVPLEELAGQARRSLDQLLKHVQDFAKKEGGLYGKRDFYLGFCERILFSSLIDADWRDTADFMAGKKAMPELGQLQIQQVWEKGLKNLEERLNSFNQTARLTEIRREISDRCRKAALTEHNLFRLAVPTGAGKTLASFRFALQNAAARKKRHIFYVAPFKSILEQNAEEIRKIFEGIDFSAEGITDIVLEHHGDVVLEREDDFVRYERFIENWDEIPVTVTTAVQFFQALYKGKRSNIRRFHSLCDSVIILDEVQAVPVRLLQLLNLAVNFLTEFCNTTVVLCTATQPLLDRMAENSMLPAVEMAGSISEFEEAFRRVEYHDCTKECAAGFSIGQAVDFVAKQAEIFGQVLAVFNTKASARQVYEGLKEQGFGNLYCLSTWMCAKHRSDKLAEIKEKLSDGEKIICVSTQLVEAGVDFSFRCVIRSLAGLDNLIQTAGRCNRNGAPEMGHVYLIRMSAEAEKTASLSDIRESGDAMRGLLEAFRENTVEMGGRLDSEQAIRQYYLRYLGARKEETGYTLKVEGVSTNLVELLSDNSKFAGGSRLILRQAFKTAGENFEVIEEDGGTDVLVPYGEGKELIQRLQEKDTPEGKRKLLRRLQRYSVSLSRQMLQRLGNAVYSVENLAVMVLAEGYYDGETGVRDEVSDMPLLMI